MSASIDKIYQLPSGKFISKTFPLFGGFAFSAPIEKNDCKFYLLFAELDYDTLSIATRPIYLVTSGQHDSLNKQYEAYRESSIHHHHENYYLKDVPLSDAEKIGLQQITDEDIRKASLPPNQSIYYTPISSPMPHNKGLHS